MYAAVLFILYLSFNIILFASQFSGAGSRCSCSTSFNLLLHLLFSSEGETLACCPAPPHRSLLSLRGIGQCPLQRSQRRPRADPSLLYSSLRWRQLPRLRPPRLRAQWVARQLSARLRGPGCPVPECTARTSCTAAHRRRFLSG